MTTKKKILVSTDIGSDPDDALSLLAILNSGINLRGIYTVNGDVISRSYIAKHLVNLTNRRVKVACGESLPLGSAVKPYKHLEDCLVDDSFLDHKKMDEDYQTHYKELKKVGIGEDAVKDMAQVLSKGKHIIFSIGPMTNIAKLIDQHPNSIKNIERIYIMGFKFPEGELEHNVRFDSVAAARVVESEIPLTIIPSDICSRYRMPFDMCDRMNNTPAGQYVRKMVRAYVCGELARIIRTDSSTILEAINSKTYTKLKTLTKKRRKEIIVEMESERLFLANFDIYTAFYETEEFWEGFWRLVKSLDDPGYINKTRKTVSDRLKESVPNSVSVADVYIPYCYLNPNRIKIERMNLNCNFQGETILFQGEKHEVVRDLDYDDFRRFLEDNLK